MSSTRQARIEDVSALKAIDTFGERLNTYSGLDKLDPQAEEQDDTSYYEEFINEDNKWCYVVEDNGEIEGSYGGTADIEYSKFTIAIGRKF